MNRHRNPKVFIWLALTMFVSFTTLPNQADEVVMTNPIAPHAQLDQTIFNSDFFPLLTWDKLHGRDQSIVHRKNGLASMKECDELGLTIIVVSEMENL